MAKYRQIHLTFWQDPFIEELQPLEKYFYLYLMTNSKTTQCGCYEISMKLVKYETGLTQKQIDSFIDSLVEARKIHYNEQYSEFLILNWLKHNSFKSPKVKSCIMGEMEFLKNRVYIDFINSILNGNTPTDSLSIVYPKSIDSGSQQEQEEEQEYNKNNNITTKEKETTYEDVFNYCLTLDLINHKTYTGDMTKAMKRAEKELKIDCNYMKKMLKRHNEKVKATANNEHPVKKRPLAEFFGQTKYKSSSLICSDYLDEIYQEVKNGYNGANQEDESVKGYNPDDFFREREERKARERLNQ